MTMPTTAARQPRSKWVAALAATSVVALSACGGSDTGDGSANDNGDQLTVVRVGSTLTMNQVLSTVAITSGLGEDHGLQLERLATLTADSAAQLGAMQAGDVDVTVPGLNSAVDMIAAGADVTIFGAAGPYAGGITIANQALEESGVSLEAPIEERLQALRGLDVATGPDGSTANAIFRLILEEAGLDPDSDVNIIPLRDMSGVVAVGLERGTYDAAFAPLGTAEPAVASGAASVLGSVPGGDFPVLDNYSAPAYVASTAYVEENPEVIEAFLATLEDARLMIVENPEEARDLVKEESFAEMDDEIFDAAWEQAALGFEDWDVRFGADHWDMFVENFDHLSEHDYESMSFEDIVYQGQGN